jgi:hypothetical protein
VQRAMLFAKEPVKEPGSSAKRFDCGEASGTAQLMLHHMSNFAYKPFGLHCGRNRNRNSLSKCHDRFDAWTRNRPWNCSGLLRSIGRSSVTGASPENSRLRQHSDHASDPVVGGTAMEEGPMAAIVLAHVEPHQKAGGPTTLLKQRTRWHEQFCSDAAHSTY